jgi:hypothetical protein
MADNASERLARIEATIHEMGAIVRRQSETTAQGFETLTNMMRALDPRMNVLDARMAELISELRGHSHEIA